MNRGTRIRPVALAEALTLKAEDDPDHLEGLPDKNIFGEEQILCFALDKVNKNWRLAITDSPPNRVVHGPYRQARDWPLSG